MARRTVFTVLYAILIAPLFAQERKPYILVLEYKNDLIKRDGMYTVLLTNAVSLEEAVKGTSYSDRKIIHSQRLDGAYTLVLASDTTVTEVVYDSDLVSLTTRPRTAEDKPHIQGNIFHFRNLSNTHQSGVSFYPNDKLLPQAVVTKKGFDAHPVEAGETYVVNFK